MEKFAAASIPAEMLTRKRVVCNEEGFPLYVEEFTPVADDQHYCWRFTDLDAKHHYIGADEDVFGVLRFAQDENLGNVVGYLTKLDPRTGEIKYGGLEPRHTRPVRAKELEAWAGMLVAARTP